jgi:hypothetical protein
LKKYEKNGYNRDPRLSRGGRDGMFIRDDKFEFTQYEHDEHHDQLQHFEPEHQHELEQHEHEHEHKHEQYGKHGQPADEFQYEQSSGQQYEHKQKREYEIRSSGRSAWPHQRRI